jgi:formylglycine-generating enzyme required for sulfatase activity
VTVSSFWIDTTEVTQAEYQAVMKTNPSHFLDDTLFPVEYLTWFDAVLFCNARSKRDGFDTVYRYTSMTGTAGNGCTAMAGLARNQPDSNPGYRLPTEAEWEYACRAGTKTLFYWGDTMDDDYCWHFANSNSTTHPVAGKKPNLFGLYDMTGNVWEFCFDWEGPYTADAQIDPTGPSTPTGGSRIIRGASWTYNSPSYWYSACRNGYTPDYQDYHWNTGFRCVR